MSALDTNKIVEKCGRIRELNDRFRGSFLTGGVFVITPGIEALPKEVQAAALRRVLAFKDWTDGNDPYGEHDFGAFDFGPQKFFWKIDYYAKLDWETGSEDPADRDKTTRVLTLMLADEY